jgi:hypothetical protein
VWRATKIGSIARIMIVARSLLVYSEGKTCTFGTPPERLTGKPRRAPFLKCGHTIDARRVHLWLWLSVAWLDVRLVSRGGLRVPLHVCAAQDAHMH